VENDKIIEGLRPLIGATHSSHHLWWWLLTSTFWELYLFNVFKKWNFKIDFNYKMPDFNIISPFDICVEAVIANNAFSETPEWERDYLKTLAPDEMEKIIYTSTLRLSNAIITKYKKYQTEYSSSKHVTGRPFVFAVAPFDQPYFWEQTQQAINQVLFGYKKTLYENDEVKNTRKIFGHEYIDFIIKDNEAEIPLGFFTNNLMPEISAIIFSNVATMGKIRALTKNVDPRMMLFCFSKFNRNGLKPFEGMLPKEQYFENLENGLGLLLNPYAKYPLDEDFIKLFLNFTYWDEEIRCPLGDGRDGDLYKRMVQVIKVIDDDEK
jgi:hypothetical protein